MAEIVLNVEVRERAGRAARRAGEVPGVLYGGDKGAVSIAVKAGEFNRALHTGKLLGHLVTLKYGDESQPVIAKDVQFHPVTDVPTHFDLYRVEANQQIRINVPVHFRNHELSPGLKRGGTLNIDLHELELMVGADQIPEELLIDLTGMDIGDSVRASEIALPAGAELSPQHRESTVASIATSSALAAEEEEEAEGEGEEAPAEEAPAEEAAEAE